MKKYAVIVLSFMFFLLSFTANAEILLDNAENDALLEAENTSELLYYQNFDNLPTGKVESGEISSMFGLSSVFKDLGKIGYGVIGSGAKFEICEEADGNKYLKVTGSMYNAFGVHFLDENGAEQTKYAVMDFNYKYPEAGKYAMVKSFGYKKKGEVYNSDWSTSSNFTDNTMTAWTNNKKTAGTSAADSYVMSPCLGLAFNQSGNTYKTYEIHIDDFSVWSFTEKRETSHTSAVSKTVSFANSTGVTATTLPAAVKGVAWYNLYNGQTGKTQLNLNDYTATANGYEFKGWSMADGGLKIKDVDYTAFKVIGDITLYPIWEKIIYKPVVKSEDFEDFTVGQTLTSNDLDFITLNNFGAAGFTATVIYDDETASKALKLESTAMYSGFSLKNRAVNTGEGSEYFTFNYRFASEDAGSRFTIYAGKDHTGSNQKAAITSRKTTWERLIQRINTSYATAGCFFDENKGNYSIIIDDVYYWFVPAECEENDKKVSVTFENAAGLVPDVITLPSKKQTSIWNTSDNTNNTVNLKSTIPSGYSSVYTFKGWAKKENGTNIVKECDILQFRTLENTTLYAVWEYASPESGYDYSIRTGTNAGIRFSSSVTASQRNAATEYGYVVARNDVLEHLGFTADDLSLTLTHESVDKPLGKLYLKGVAYENLDGGEPETDISYGDTDDSATIFSAVCTGIDTSSKAAVTTELVVRPYIVINGTYCYGTPMVKSYYDVAVLVKESGIYNELPDEQKDFISNVISVGES